MAHHCPQKRTIGNRITASAQQRKVQKKLEITGYIYCNKDNVDLTICYMFNAFVDNDSLRADSCRHLSWGMTGDTVLHVKRVHKHPGVASVGLYHNARWVMDNWLTNKPLFEKMVDLKQYPFGTMKKEQHVPTYLLH
eukprot:13279824-Ditylum_brightwellii.AAC.2